MTNDDTPFSFAQGTNASHMRHNAAVGRVTQSYGEINTAIDHTLGGLHNDVFLELGVQMYKMQATLVPTPFSEGYQQIQDPYPAVSSVIEGLLRHGAVPAIATLPRSRDENSPVVPMRPIPNSPEMLLAQALKNDTVQATAGAGLTTRNASTFAALSLRSVIKMSGDDTASEVYPKRLLLEEVGYSLWPLDQNVSQAYCDLGVSIDYVDKITWDGAFKYKIK
ncbi:hypothetical protein PILCRDRAFT_795541 [Piloderma croceum F 1598]|uniref:Uncharacterized protein n=1 Tax=Piloderma croceum (strain F 1598) TaxID=765440 RepID=A0A0C3BK47_PILCF|nr:hypothetical protein PILCRDRAFT_795541 [Piloderma croceum F 1598]